MHEITKEFRFEAAHTLLRDVNATGSRRIHGHSYRAEIVVRGMPDPETGMVIDLGLLDLTLKAVRENLDHHFLNDIADLGPATLENLAAWIWRDLVRRGVEPAKVVVARDASGDSCTYSGPN